jgi:subtilisin family serine protease
MKARISFVMVLVALLAISFLVSYSAAQQPDVDPVMVYTVAQEPDIEVIAPPLEAALCPDLTTTLEFSICNTGTGTLEWTLWESATELVYLDEDAVVDVPAVEARPNVASRTGAVGRPAQQFEMHLGWMSLQTVDLLIVTPDVVGGGDISLLLNTLAAFPDLNVTVWDASVGTPGVADMMAYDVVFVGNDILWTSSAIDKTALSDTLADYIDAGGKVLAGSFVWSFDDWGLGGGRFITEDYSPYEMATQDFWDPIGLGAYDAGHPIMTGIVTATEGYNHQDPALSPSGTWVASWQDSENYVAVSPSAVGLNQLHFHQAAFGGQTGELLHNALLYLAPSGPVDVPWLTEVPTTGLVLPGECVTVEVTFDSQWMIPGDYFADLIIESNDPDEPEITLPVTMTVLDCTGGVDGYVTDFETGGTNPTCTSALVGIEPGDLEVPAGPDGYYWAILDPGTYTLTASAPLYSTETAVVTVTTGMTTTQDLSLRRPAIEAVPAGFTVSLTIDDAATLPLTVTNAGHMPLDWGLLELPSGAALSVARSPAFQTTWLEGDVEIDPQVLAELDTDDQADLFVQMRLQADLSPAYRIEDWSERGQYVYGSLQAAAEAQAPIVAYARERDLAYETRLSNNSVFIKGGSLADVNILAARADVRQIRANRMYQIEDVEPSSAPETWGWNLGALGPDDDLYGMQAMQVWQGFDIDGEGIVVASIDTGVFYQHEALVQQYRGNNGDGTFDHDYNWYAPTITATVQCGGEAAIAPCDEDNHGSAVTGIMVGETEDLVEQTGVAPGAQWIACMGCDGYGPGGPGGCSEEALTKCADWMVAPCPIGVDPGDPACDPDMRPHVVNNSWGSEGCDLWYEGYIQAWVAAGIFPAFSAGNTAACGTVGSPGDTPEAFGTAAHDYDGVNLYAGGPSCHFPEPSCDPNAHQVDPHLNAPTYGRTAGNLPGFYVSLGGTSGASPHTAGCVALMWAANPSLVGDVDTTYTMLEQSADRTSTQPWAEGACGKPACAGGDTYPNYEYGWGYLDCYAAVEWALTLDGDLPWVGVDPVTGTLPPEDSVAIDVTFTCTQTGEYSGMLFLTHNDPCADPINIPLHLYCTEIEQRFVYLPIVVKDH